MQSLKSVYKSLFRWFFVAIFLAAWIAISRCARSNKSGRVLTQQSDTLAKLVANLVNTIDGKANNDT